jgi:membrane protein DedA with SNARE-associated domain
MAKMPLGKFSLYTALALVPYSFLYIYLGMKLKDNWETIGEYAGPYIKPLIIAAIVLTILYAGYQFYLKRKTKV